MKGNLDKHHETGTERPINTFGFPKIGDLTKLVEILAALLIVLFVYAATTKILDLQKFQIELGKSPILSSYAGAVSVCIPILELMISALFFIQPAKQLAFYLSFGLMVAFTTYIIVILNFSDYIPCSCGGVISKMTWHQHILFNLFFVTISAIGVLLSPSTILSADKGETENPKKSRY